MLFSILTIFFNKSCIFETKLVTEVTYLNFSYFARKRKRKCDFLFAFRSLIRTFGCAALDACGAYSSETSLSEFATFGRLSVLPLPRKKILSVTIAYVNIWGHRAGVVMWNESTQSAVFEIDGTGQVSDIIWV